MGLLRPILYFVLTLVVILSFNRQGQSEDLSHPVSNVSTEYLLSQVITRQKIAFQAMTNAVWRAPAPKRETPVILALRIINRSQTGIQFSLFDTLTMRLKTSTGKELPISGGRDATGGGQPYSPLIAPGQSFEVSRPAHLQQAANGTLQLVFRDGFGGVWRFDNLHRGHYRLQLVFKHTPDQPNLPSSIRPKEPLWIGSIETNPLQVHIQ